jgi:hypothetical protein
VRGIQSALIRDLPLGDAPLIIGRAAGNDMRIDDATVARRRVQGESTAEGFARTEPGGRNGSLVKGQGVARAIFRPDDWISAGSPALIFWDSVAVRVE